MALTGRLGAARAAAGCSSSRCVGVSAGVVLRGRLVRAGARSRVDLALAGPVAATAASPDAATRRCASASAADVTLRVTNTGRRRSAAAVRDAWPPSAGARNRHRHRSTCRPASGARSRPSLRADPARRPARRPGDACAPSGPLGLAARQGSHARAVAGAGRCRRSRRASTCRRSWPGCASSTAGRRCSCAGRAREFDSLREYVRGDDVRSIDWRASARAARRRGPHLAARARPARAARARHRRGPSAGRVGDAPRLDAAMDAALLLAALAARAGDRVDLLAGDRRVRAARAGLAGAASCWPRSSTRWPPLEPELVETDWEPSLAEVLQPRAASARSSCCSPRSTRRRSRRACCPCCRLLTRRHRVRARLGRRPAGRARWPPAAATPTRCTTPRPAHVQCSPGAGSRRPARPRSASTVVEGDPEELPPRPGRRATSRSRPPAGSEPGC